MQACVWQLSAPAMFLMLLILVDQSTRIEKEKKILIAYTLLQKKCRLVKEVYDRAWFITQSSSPTPFPAFNEKEAPAAYLNYL